MDHFRRSRTSVADVDTSGPAAMMQSNSRIPGTFDPRHGPAIVTVTVVGVVVCATALSRLCNATPINAAITVIAAIIATAVAMRSRTDWGVGWRTLVGGLLIGFVSQWIGGPRGETAPNFVLIGITEAGVLLCLVMAAARASRARSQDATTMTIAYGGLCISLLTGFSLTEPLHRASTPLVPWHAVHVLQAFAVALMSGALVVRVRAFRWLRRVCEGHEPGWSIVPAEDVRVEAALPPWSGASDATRAPAAVLIRHIPSRGLPHRVIAAPTPGRPVRFGIEAFGGLYVFTAIVLVAYIAAVILL